VAEARQSVRRRSELRATLQAELRGGASTVPYLKDHQCMATTPSVWKVQRILRSIKRSKAFAKDAKKDVRCEAIPLNRLSRQATRCGWNDVNIDLSNREAFVTAAGIGPPPRDSISAFLGRKIVPVRAGSAKIKALMSPSAMTYPARELLECTPCAPVKWLKTEMDRPKRLFCRPIVGR
jgi:hypothetical protein